MTQLKAYSMILRVQYGVHDYPRDVHHRVYLADEVDKRITELEAALDQVQRAEQIWNRTLELRQRAEKAEAALAALQAQLNIKEK